MKDATIKQLRTEIEKLNKKLESTVNTTSAKRKQKLSGMRSTKVPRVSLAGSGYVNHDKILMFITDFKVLRRTSNRKMNLLSASVTTETDVWV